MYPHERSLVQKFKDKPFAILAVNSDPKQRLQKILDDKTIQWQCIWDGGSPGGPLATKWKVHGWPTLFLIDGKGIIRYKEIRGEELEQAIESLLKETKSND